VKYANPVIQDLKIIKCALHWHLLIKT